MNLEVVDKAKIHIQIYGVVKHDKSSFHTHVINKKESNKFFRKAVFDIFEDFFQLKNIY